MTGQPCQALTRLRAPAQPVGGIMTGPRCRSLTGLLQEPAQPSAGDGS